MAVVGSLVSGLTTQSIFKKFVRFFYVTGKNADDFRYSFAPGFGTT